MSAASSPISSNATSRRGTRITTSSPRAWPLAAERLPSRPSTTRAAATKPVAKQRYALVNGAVKFMVPGDWKEKERGGDDMTVTFSSPDDRATLYVHVKPQEYPIPSDNARFREMMKNN